MTREEKLWGDPAGLPGASGQDSVGGKNLHHLGFPSGIWSGSKDGRSRSRCEVCFLRPGLDSEAEPSADCLILWL